MPRFRRESSYELLSSALLMQDESTLYAAESPYLIGATQEGPALDGLIALVNEERERKEREEALRRASSSSAAAAAAEASRLEAEARARAVDPDLEG
jgi:hypothetical protein